MIKTCDLHTHSVFSDGTCTPAEIIERAERAGLSAVALCDHNTADGLLEFTDAAKGKKTEAVAGAEFSVDYNGRELHLLGLFIARESFAAVTEITGEFHRRKEESNRELVLALNVAGYRIDFEKIKNGTPTGKFNRMHVALALVEAGYMKTKEEAFSTVLKKGAGYYNEPRRESVFEMIRFIKDIGAVPVLAHPFLNLNEEELRAFLPLAKEAGLCGMECIYSLYDEKATALSKALADEFGILCSGGSDFHGENKPDIALGIGKGDLCIPYDLALALRNKK